MCIRDRPQPPADGQPISVIRSRVKVSANGNGNANGHTNGNGHANGNGNGYAAPPAAGQQLRLYLPRTGDYDADVLQMHKIDRLLRESAGDDNMFLHLPAGANVVVLQPRHKVRCSDELIGALRSELGAESVVLEQ